MNNAQLRNTLPPEDQQAEFLLCAKTVSSAFLKLDLMDAREQRALNAKSKAPWAFAADGGNKYDVHGDA